MQSSRITTSSSNDSINTISGRAPCSIEATLVRTDHQNKVRCLKHDSRSARFLTLSADATVKEWDAQRMEVVSTMAIQRPQDAVCMELDMERGLCAVGYNTIGTFFEPHAHKIHLLVVILCSSYTHVSLADPRSSNSTVHEFDYKKSEPLGARSLALSSHILVVGGCQGRLFFYDLRAQRFLDMGRRGATDIAEGATWRMSGENVGSQRYRPFHTASSGWLVIIGEESAPPKHAHLVPTHLPNT